VIISQAVVLKKSVRQSFGLIFRASLTKKVVFSQRGEWSLSQLSGMTMTAKRYPAILLSCAIWREPAPAALLNARPLRCILSHFLNFTSLQGGSRLVINWTIAATALMCF
jgi:hypothetical protein